MGGSELIDRHAIAEIFEQCGTLLELKGENPFRCNAYHNAARAIERLEGSLEQMLASGDLAKVKGIGTTIVEKVAEIVRTSRLEFHEELLRATPPGLIEMLRINGLGPKRIKLMHDELGIDSLPSLRQAIDDGRLAKMKGFGSKSVQKILEAILFLDRAGKRVLLPTAIGWANRLMEPLRQHPDVRRISLCGSLRRGRDTIKDIDILVASERPDELMTLFTTLPEVAQVVAHGSTKSSVILDCGMAADLRIVTSAQFPFALHYFTGSKEHNVAVRSLAQSKGYKLNEYELVGPDGPIPCDAEADIFRALGLDFIPPELREDTGEIESATRGEIPFLLERADITGVFHCHTTASDGQNSLEEMALACQSHGYSYLGIADHSQSAFYANGLSADRIAEQHRQIDQLQKKMPSFRIFKGVESDILADGSLDYPDTVLASFDYVVASIHQPMNMSAPEMTRRIIRAISHPRCTMLGHPSGRLLLQRDAYPMDVEEILKAAARYGTLIEINANPRRLDLDWVHCKRAKALGVKLVINPDAHATSGFDDVEFGVTTARRGWQTKDDVFNTQHVDAIEQRLAWLRNRAPAD
ncbi:DNA polymerase/3'-5' exonuclease PolX [bacterium]|nr:DNA polymerase/3'-5' exonuclease PolX [bacterium]